MAAWKDKHLFLNLKTMEDKTIFGYAFEVSNSSVSPILKEGDIIFGKKTIIDDIVSGELYVIKTPLDLYVKVVHKPTQNTLVLENLNPLFEDIIVDVKNVIEVYRVTKKLVDIQPEKEVQND